MARPLPDMTVQLVGGGADWLGSIASIVGALAWPTVIITCVILFHAEIRAILSRVTSFGFGSVTAQVDQNLRATEVLSAATASEGAAGPGLNEEQSGNAAPAGADETLAEVGDPSRSPEQAGAPVAPSRRKAGDRIRRRASTGTFKPYKEWAAEMGSDRHLPIGQRMVQAFSGVDELIHTLASRHAVPPELSTLDAVTALTGMGVISGPFGGLLGSQLQLRDMVANNGGSGISEFQARQFIEQLGDSKLRLEELLSSPTAP